MAAFIGIITGVREGGYITVRDLMSKTAQLYTVEQKYFRKAFPSEVTYLKNNFIKNIIENENRQQDNLPQN